MTSRDTADSNEERTDGGLNRRDVLKATGGAAGSAVVLGAATGSASAHEFSWYGCSQVCISTNKNSGNCVVIWTGDDFRYEDDFEGKRQRKDIEKDNAKKSKGRHQSSTWNGGKHCVEIGDGEAIVGVCEDGGGFVQNPNRCAQNYPPANGEEDVDCSNC